MCGQKLLSFGAMSRAGGARADQMSFARPHVAPSPKLGKARGRLSRIAPAAPVPAPVAPSVSTSLHPLLFLDFDGVIAFSHPTKSAMERLRRCRVATLNTVIARTGCLVVVSSFWRLDPRTGLGFGARQLQAWLNEAGFVGEIVGITKHLPGYGVRGLEIQAWLDENDVEPGRRVAIVDDFEPMGALTTRLVRTDYDAGLTVANADALVVLLGEVLA